MPSALSVNDVISRITHDLKSPSVTNFSNSLNDVQEFVKELHKTFETDVAILMKFKRVLKSVSSSGMDHANRQLILCDMLDALSDSGLYPNIEVELQEIGSGIGKYSIILRDMATRYQNQMRQFTNFLLFPLKMFLKDTLNQDCRRHFEKALKDYYSKVERVKKLRTQAAKDAGHFKNIDTSLQLEDIEKEKRLVQFYLCEFLLAVNELNTKKSSEFFLRLVDFFNLQRRYFSEGADTMEHLAIFLRELADKVGSFKSMQEDQRRTLNSLREELKRLTHPSPNNAGGTPNPLSRQYAGTSMADSGTSSTTIPLGYSLHQRQHQDERHYLGTEMDGFLYKRSESKVKRQWLKRRVAIHHGQIFLYHGTKDKPPVVLPLLTCQLKDVVHPASSGQQGLESSDSEILSAIGLSSSGHCYFDLVSNNRTYHFMTERESDKRRWMTVLHNAMEQVFQSAMHQAAPAPKSIQNSLDLNQVNASAYQHPRASHRRHHSTGAGLIPWQPLLPVKDPSSSKTLVEPHNLVDSGEADFSSSKIIEIIRSLPGNDVCADCYKKDPDWVSTNLGVLICLECCGVHRQLGVHLSRTQSLAMDNLSPHELLLPRFIGNMKFNKVYEATLPPNSKPIINQSIPFSKGGGNSNDEMANMEKRKTFILAKYKERAYVLNGRLIMESIGFGEVGLYRILLWSVRHSNLSCLLQMYGEQCELLRPLSDDVMQDTCRLNNTALHIAISCGGFSIDAGASLLLRESRIADSRNLATIAFLLQNASNSDYLYHSNSLGETAAHYCARFDHPEALKLLIKACGITDKMLKKVNTNNETALQLAESRGHMQCAHLLQKWADTINSQDISRLPAFNRPSFIAPVSSWNFVMNLQLSWFDRDPDSENEDISSSRLHLQSSFSSPSVYSHSSSVDGLSNYRLFAQSDTSFPSFMKESSSNEETIEVKDLHRLPPLTSKSEVIPSMRSEMTWQQPNDPSYSYQDTVTLRKRTIPESTSITIPFDVPDFCQPEMRSSTINKPRAISAVCYDAKIPLSTFLPSGSTAPSFSRIPASASQNFPFAEKGDSNGKSEAIMYSSNSMYPPRRETNMVEPVYSRRGNVSSTVVEKEAIPSKSGEKTLKYENRLT